MHCMHAITGAGCMHASTQQLRAQPGSDAFTSMQESHAESKPLVSSLSSNKTGAARRAILQGSKFGAQPVVELRKSLGEQAMPFPALVFVSTETTRIVPAETESCPYKHACLCQQLGVMQSTLHCMNQLYVHSAGSMHQAADVSLSVQTLPHPLVAGLSAAAYMSLPASQYSVLDARKIERINDDMFR